MTENGIEAKSYRRPKKVFFMLTPARPSMVSMGRMAIPEKTLKDIT